MTPTIEINVSPKGDTTVQTSGFTGASCRQASRFLEEALGKRSSERLTAEFYETAVAQQSQPQRH
jgi:hypothetical protein